MEGVQMEAVHPSDVEKHRPPPPPPLASNASGVGEFSDATFSNLHREAVSLTEHLLNELKALKQKILIELNDERRKLEAEKANWAKLSEKYKSSLQQLENKGGFVKLNIGGRIFTTNIENLLRDEHSFFSGMFSGGWRLELDEDGCVFIDRNPICFEYIMAYLRGDGEFYVNHLSNEEIAMLHREADFYQLQGLMKLTSSRLIRFEIPTSCQSVALSGNQTIARRVSVGLESDAIAYGPPFDLGDADSIGGTVEYHEHSVRFIAGNNIDVGVASLALAKAPHLRTGGQLPAASTHFRRFFIPVNSKVSIRLHRDGSVSYTVDDRPQGTAFTGLSAGQYVLAVMLNSKNDCVEMLS